ncbi:S10 family peptidase [Kozakia baliensis]|uniref:Peptidase S10 n=1 Tax=Kozakia baliensis TaxID=153496 RepID=A0A1D8UUH5_9PROT|nr:peptidase S10 [Kozakia baliensis]AOX17289.1 peptidase S10 [Kozakia baliensis]GEL63283.1 peptidase S10 [Kozakia baliensis]
MKNGRWSKAALAAGLGILTVGTALAAPDEKKDDKPPAFFTKPQQVMSEGSVTIHGQAIPYRAESGTLIVHPAAWDDANPDAKAPDAAASIFYVAYFKKGAKAENRPITFVYNGGPGSATLWLHMGAFGPKRVVTTDDSHTPAAPYQLVNNDDSLLDSTDLVFIDAPGTGFGRITGKDREKAFYGTDPDAEAFTNFIAQFLARHGRYNSPKYLFGESYGTTRSAIIANMLAEKKGIDLNGVILLSQILDYANSIDRPQTNPSMDQPYVLALPSYAATAWYHHKLPDESANLTSFLREVEHFALTDYTEALQEGTSISDEKLDAIAEKLHLYTGLPVDYLKRANLRVNGGEFEKTLLGGDGIDTGRLDSRFAGPSMDPLSQRPDYDPQSAAMEAAYVSAFNDYARNTLHFGGDPAFGDGYEEYKIFLHNLDRWTFLHKQPDQKGQARGEPNVLPDLAAAMKANPALQIMLNQGYFDLGTPYFEGIYEMRHLPIPRELAKNIEIKQYQSGHMVYAHAPALHQMHDNVVQFIARTHPKSS